MNRRLQGRREFCKIPPSLIEFLFKVSKGREEYEAGKHAEEKS